MTESLEVFGYLAQLVNGIPSILLYAIYAGVPVVIVAAVANKVRGVRSGDD